MSQKPNENRPPVHTARAGNIRASVWESTDAAGQARFKVVISRMFRQNEGWQRGHTFYSDQLAPVIEAASKAQQWIEHRQRQLQFTPAEVR